jgi:histidine ammonia-lyase
MQLYFFFFYFLIFLIFFIFGVPASLPPLELDLTAGAWQRVRASRAVVDRLVAEKKVVYGITTGFGNFANVSIASDEVEQLQYNLITSHAAGVGDAVSLERTLSLMVLRINTLAKGYSGIRPETLRHMLDAFNRKCVPFVPDQGSVGASGDLAPLAHLACGLIGVGKMWDARAKAWLPAADVLAANGLAPIRLAAKEGLSMINGTQFITSIAAEAIGRAETLVRVADIVAAFTLEALQGTYKAFDPRIHAARPHAGQAIVARRVRALLHSQQMPSQVYESHKNCGKVQDSYTLRCIPQVHGVVNDTLAFVRGIIETEMNRYASNGKISVFSLILY